MGTLSEVDGHSNPARSGIMGWKKKRANQEAGDMGDRKKGWERRNQKQQWEQEREMLPKDRNKTDSYKLSVVVM